jgi:hypothetical protein
VQLKDAIQETTNKEITQQVAARFEKKTKVLDTNTFFVKQVRSLFLGSIFMSVCLYVCMYVWLWLCRAT